jgi:hypothetical protein
MKCRYRFPVKGRIMLDISHPISASGWIFECEIDNRFVKYIAVTVPLVDKEQWPTIHKNQSSETKLEIELKLHHLPFVKRELRSLQGLLSLFGLRSIDFDKLEVTWVPDTEEERAYLHITQWKKELEPIPDRVFKPFPFDVFARSIIAADAATEIEVPMNFFRRGMIDMEEGNYIEAIYDFYFILETAFGGGKFKKKEISEVFRKSPKLRNCIKNAITDPGPSITSNAKLKTKFDQTYGLLSEEDVINKIVELRGFLHHHNQKRRGMWHPDNPDPFELDALVMQDIAYNIVFSMAKEFLWNEDVVRAYNVLISKSK